MPISRDLQKLVGRSNPYMARVRGGKRTVGQRENDLVFITDRYVKGYTIKQIKDEINTAREGRYQLSYEQVYKDIQNIHARWIDSYLVNFDQAKAKELAHIDAVEQEYWAAWRRSQEKIEEVESESIKDQQGKAESGGYQRTRVKKKEIKRDGSEAYLKGVQWCIEQRCKIMGLLQSTQNINVNWRKEAEANGIDPDGVTNELIEQFLSAAKTKVVGNGGAGSLGEGAEDTEE